MRESNHRAPGEHGVKRKDRINRMDRINLKNGLPTEEFFQNDWMVLTVEKVQREENTCKLFQGKFGVKNENRN